MLSGVRVLDLSRVLAGPWCAQHLADLGAEVTKVERAGGGDDTRGWGPPFVEGEHGRVSAYWASCNRGKRVLFEDLSDPEAAARVRAMALASDVVIENFKPGGLAQFGLDAASLRAERPGLIVVSITGFGQTGPWADRAGYDLLIQAMGGLMSFTGQPDGPPTKVGVAVVDLMAGMYAASAALAALVRRGRTGEGAHVDVSLFDCQLAWLANQGMNALASGVAPARLGNAHPNLVPYEVFRAADGWLVLAVGNDRQMAALADVAGRPEWKDDVRFQTNEARVRHREEVVAAVASALAERPRAWWFERLEAVHVPCGPVLDVNEALATEVAAARGAVGPMWLDGVGTVDGLRGPVVVDGRRLG
jgi:crotonobetainyl-CoA:carnitine CoA-transferase CaiB-like acyl-CoA transferase